MSKENPSAQTDEYFMKVAVDQAYIAEEQGDVPIGCVIVHNGRMIAKAHNQRELLNDPTAHAEMIAITQASSCLESWRLKDCTIYVTLEPCPMCAGALVLARIDRLIFGCADPKTGSAGSIYNIVDDPRLNHSIAVTKGVLENECSSMLSSFFARRRMKNSNQ